MGAGVLSLKWLVQLPKLRGLIEPEISVGLVWEVMAATLLVGILGSIYPAWRAMRLNPVDALKYE
jgi:putative ABC transport system permease protein